MPREVEVSLDAAMDRATTLAEQTGVRHRVAPVKHSTGQTVYAINPEVAEPCS